MSKPKPPPTFAARLRQMREAAGWSMYRLAQEAGVTAQAIANMEARQAGADPKWSTVCRIADALGVPTDAFRRAD